MARYIAFEGIDGSGKSEVSRSIANMIQGSVLTREPTAYLAKVIMANTTPTGDALLFAADRARGMIDIQKWLEEGKTVVTDRSVYSNMAYQGASLKTMFGGLEHAFEWIYQCNKPFLIPPHKTLLLDLPVDTALTRVSNRGKATRFEMKDYLEDVRTAYHLLAKEYDFEIVDATQPLAEVVENCKQILGL